MADLLTPSPMQRFVDANGNALVGGKLFTYQAGTTTKANVYTDSGGATPFSNPIILNSRGEPETVAMGASTGIWLVPGTFYKFVLSPSTDTDPPTNAIWTVDNIEAPTLTGSGFYPVSFEFLGGSPPLTSETMGMHYFAVAVTFPANFGAGSGVPASGGYFRVTATASFTATMQDQSGNAMGTMVVALGAHTPTFTTPAGNPLSVAAGTTMIVIAPSSVDSTLANGAWTLSGSLT